MTISEFSIKRLNGIRDYHIRFRDNRLILVGENGTGKTTVLKMLYFLVAREWPALLCFDFESLSLHFFDEEKSAYSVECNKGEIEELASGPIADEIYIRRRVGNDWNSGAVFCCILETYNDLMMADSQAESVADRRRHRFVETCNKDKLFCKYRDADSNLRSAFEGKVLYLPTYRRIEEEFDSLVYGSQTASEARRMRSLPAFESEMIKFGMEDVEMAIHDKEDEIRRFSQGAQNDLTLRYLKRILSREYETIEDENLALLDENSIRAVLDRIDENILAEAEKEEVYRIVSSAASPSANMDTLGATEKIICHYFSLLSEFDKSLVKHERCFVKFCEICNSYLVSNKIVYEEQSYSCKVVNLWRRNAGNEQEDNPSGRLIGLNDLSSGEKQIVALFSRLNLQNRDSVFVFIDEPELSLSIAWQRRLLVDIVESVSCSGLFATTHSPFIFDNMLIDYVRGVNEFVDQEQK